MRRPWEWTRRPLVLPASSAAEDAELPCVVHLVRAVNGLDAPREFARALRRHDAGREYELVLAMKGFSSPSQAAPHAREFIEMSPTVLFFDDVGSDVGVFLGTAERLRRSRYFFTNSNVRPSCEGWLAKLDGALRSSGAGLVGPFGSWASSHSWLRYSLGLPSAYSGGVLPPRREARAMLLEIDFEQLGIERRAAARTTLARLQLLSRVPEELLDFDPFPNHHLRTSAFMVSHAVLREMRLFRVRSKMDAYALESGSDSFTRQAERMGLRALVVDRGGAVYERDAWDCSGTLWQGEQKGLLASDNRTLAYECGDAVRRRLLSALAWGAATETDRSAAPASLPDRVPFGVASRARPPDRVPSGRRPRA